jgi:anti-anti-sigma regulatory factor
VLAPAAMRRQVVRLHGALTATSAGHVLDLLRSVCPAPAEVEIDLSHVTSVERSGAGLLIDAYVTTVLRRRAFAVSAPSADCRQSLERLGVLDVIDVMDVATERQEPRRIP